MSTFLSFEVRSPLEQYELDVACATDSRALGLFGPSGSGKTTLVEVLAGWRAVASGRIEVAGEVWLDSSRGFALEPARRRIGYVPQDLLLFPHLDVAANVLFGGVRNRGHCERVLDVLEIGSLRSRDIATLSGGEKQRVALARALCCQPKLLVLDEPLGALDRPLRRRILPYLIRARAEFDLPMVIVSHDPTEIGASCEHALVLERGRVVAAGRPNDVLAPRSVGEGEFENVVSGVVQSIGATTARVSLGTASLEVPLATLRVGQHAVIAIRADDVLVATQRPMGLSARNVVPARIERILRGADARVLARIGDRSIWIELTDGALDELALREGNEVFAVIKTRACRVLSGGGRP